MDCSRRTGNQAVKTASSKRLLADTLVAVLMLLLLCFTGVLFISSIEVLEKILNG